MCDLKRQIVGGGAMLYHFNPSALHTQEYYVGLVGTLTNNHCHQHYCMRLVEALNNLLPPSLPLDLSRNSTLQFRENLEKFLPVVKGFLCYR